jgi:two-component system alkaline phosphatase synthesis response regulator PhoP
MGRNTGKFPVQRGGTGRHKAITGKIPIIGRTILVVDDEEATARLIAKILDKAGYRIVVAYDGEEALRKIADVLPDLVLLDVHLPRVDGREVCRRVKQDPRTRGIPILLMTAAHDSVRDAAEAIKLGAEEYILKPFVREVLLHNVERVLGGRPRAT